jgi:hypothetical protein
LTVTMCNNIVEDEGTHNGTVKRKRPVTIKIMASEAEAKELRRAARRADVPLATLMRAMTLDAIRRGVTITTEAKAT